jgi:hypothetical protein
MTFRHRTPICQLAHYVRAAFLSTLSDTANRITCTHYIGSTQSLKLRNFPYTIIINFHTTLTYNHSLFRERLPVGSFKLLEVGCLEDPGNSEPRQTFESQLGSAFKRESA